VEQVPTERYRVGQRLKVYVLEVERTSKGPQILVSRSHRNLLRRLLELEIPEIHNGTVEIKSIAREAGYRSKVAVAARQAGVDPVGCCVGLRGIRIQNVVNELHGEKIDVVLWHSDPAIFIANALSPAPVVNVAINQAEKTATVVVPDRQLSLAIGKEGQNARLAAKLTGWGIDIKSASVAEAERAAKVTVEEEAAPAAAEVVSEAEAVVEAATPQEVAEAAEAETVPEMVIPELEELAPEEAVAEAAQEVQAVPVEVAFAEEATFKTELEPSQLRFAEELMPHSAKADSKSKKKKGKDRRGEIAETGRAKRARREQTPMMDYDEEY
jgi:N utilization substance protein A